VVVDISRRMALASMPVDKKGFIAKACDAEALVFKDIHELVERGQRKNGASCPPFGAFTTISAVGRILFSSCFTCDLLKTDMSVISN
jgi:hypothetical protein